MKNTLSFNDFQDQLAEYRDRSDYSLDDFTYEELAKIFDFMEYDYTELKQIDEIEFNPKEIFHMWNRYENIADFISDDTSHNKEDCVVCSDTEAVRDDANFISLHLEEANQHVYVFTIRDITNNNKSYLVANLSDF